MTPQIHVSAAMVVSVHAVFALYHQLDVSIYCFCGCSHFYLADLADKHVLALLKAASPNICKLSGFTDKSCS